MFLLRICFMAFSLTLLSFPAWSGIENSTPAQRAALQTDFMKDQLKLEGSTLSKVDAINRKYAEVSEPIIKGSDNVFTKRSKMQSVMESKDKELKGVLSEDEFSRYNAVKGDLMSYLQSHL